MKTELKRELLGLIPDWRNDTNISDELYDLLYDWEQEVGV